MKLTIIISIIQLVVGCGSSDKSNNIEDGSTSNATMVTISKETLNVFDSSKNDELSGKTITITFSYAVISCGCPQWFETNYKNVKFLEGVERFYLEPTDSRLLNADNLWDGEQLPLTLKVTGRFSKEKILPPNLGSKDEPEKARIFWYDKITVLSPVNK